MARGSITPRGDSFRVRVNYRGTDGKRRQICKTASSKRAAERIRAALLVEVDKGYRKPSKETMGDFLESWLDSYARPRLTPKSFVRYESIIRVHIKSAIGDIPLAQLQPEHLQRLYATKLDAGLAPRSIRYAHVVVHKALSTALKWGKVSRNIADGVELPKASRTEMQVWSESEIKRFLDTARSTPYYALFYLALYTGARRGELLGLRWQDCDLVTGHISITRTLTQVGTRFVFGQPKSEWSRRTIALPPTATILLRQLRERTEHVRERLGTTLGDDEMVFSHSPDGKIPLRPSTVTTAWERTARKAGVKVIRFHDARHSHATLLLKQGIHPKIVQERLGHSTVAITLDIYSHVLPGMQENAAARFDAAISGTHNEIADESVTIR